jgi:CTP:molybdopterin cytidylyltransferase MocA
VSIDAVVLAAGEGRRYGMPKALAARDGRSWLEIAVGTLREGGIESIRVVLGAAVPSGLPSASTGNLSGVRYLVHPQWRLGRTGSLQCGIREATGAGVLVHQVDFPDVLPSTIAALRRAFDAVPEGESLIFVPVEAGRRGHPIVLGRALLPEILALGPDEPLRLVVRRRAERVREIPVADPGIHHNMNARAGDDPPRGFHPRDGVDPPEGPPRNPT